MLSKTQLIVIIMMMIKKIAASKETQSSWYMLVMVLGTSITPIIFTMTFMS